MIFLFYNKTYLRYSMAYLNSTFTPYTYLKKNNTMGTITQTDWQEAYHNKQNEIDRLKRIYYEISSVSNVQTTQKRAGPV